MLRPRTLFFFNDTATTEIYTLSLHDALPISIIDGYIGYTGGINIGDEYMGKNKKFGYWRDTHVRIEGRDRKSTRLNSSHANISYAVFCLKKKKVTVVKATIVRAPVTTLDKPE